MDGEPDHFSPPLLPTPWFISHLTNLSGLHLFSLLLILPLFRRVGLLQHRSSHVTTLLKTLLKASSPTQNKSHRLWYWIEPLHGLALLPPLLSPLLLLLPLDHCFSHTAFLAVSPSFPDTCITFRSGLGCHLFSEAFLRILPSHSLYIPFPCFFIYFFYLST